MHFTVQLSKFSHECEPSKWVARWRWDFLDEKVVKKTSRDTFCSTAILQYLDHYSRYISSCLPCTLKITSIFRHTSYCCGIATCNDVFDIALYIIIFVVKFLLISEFKSSRRTGNHQSKNCTRNEIDRRSDESVTITIVLLSARRGPSHTHAHVPRVCSDDTYNIIIIWQYKLLFSIYILFNWNNEMAFVRLQTLCCNSTENTIRLHIYID